MGRAATLKWKKRLKRITELEASLNVVHQQTARELRRVFGAKLQKARA